MASVDCFLCKRVKKELSQMNVSLVKTTTDQNLEAHLSKIISISFLGLACSLIVFAAWGGFDFLFITLGYESILAEFGINNPWYTKLKQFKEVMTVPTFWIIFIPFMMLKKLQTSHLDSIVKRTAEKKIYTVSTLSLLILLSGPAIPYFLFFQN